MYNYYRDALSNFKCWYVLLNILQGIFFFKYNCMTCMLMLVFVLFIKDRCKENMRKLLRAGKPNPSIVSYLALIHVLN